MPFKTLVLLGAFGCAENPDELKSRCVTLLDWFAKTREVARSSSSLAAALLAGTDVIGAPLVSACGSPLMRGAPDWALPPARRDAGSAPPEPEHFICPLSPMDLEKVTLREEGQPSGA